MNTFDIHIFYHVLNHTHSEACMHMSVKEGDEGQMLFEQIMYICIKNNYKRKKGICFLKSAYLRTYTLLAGTFCLCLVSCMVSILMTQ